MFRALKKALLDSPGPSTMKLQFEVKNERTGKWTSNAVKATEKPNEDGRGT